MEARVAIVQALSKYAYTGGLVSGLYTNQTQQPELRLGVQNFDRNSYYPLVQLTYGTTVAVDAELAKFASRGAECALRAEMTDGFVFAFADTTATLGLFTERYAPTKTLVDFYAMVAQAAKDYRGTDPLHTIRMT